MKRNIPVAILLLCLAVSLGMVAAQDRAPDGPTPRRVIVTLDGKIEDMPQLTPSDFELEVGKQKLAPARLLRPEELPTLIALVFQDNQVIEFANQLPTVKEFVLRQPANTYIGVYYFNAQSVQVAIPFHSDTQKVAAALRAPRGAREQAPPSPYNNLSGLIESMAQLPDARKEILLFSEGTDAYYSDSSAGQNPNLRGAIRAAQEAGIPVFVLYSEAFPPPNRNPGDAPSASGTIPGRGSAGNQAGAVYDPTRSSGMSTSQQVTGRAGVDSLESDSPYRPAAQYNISFLNDLTKRTGGKVFSPGKVPPDVGPFLEEFERLLSRQVLLEYAAAEPVKKVKLKRKIGGAKLLAAEQ
jgi:hypothetical protein